MAKLALTKSGLQKEKEQLRLYKKLLPSLDLKRMQLTAECANAKVDMEKLRQAADAAITDATEKLPMLANHEIDLAGLVKVKSIQLTEESIAGVKVPRLGKITFDVLDYSLLAKPHWVDAYVKHLEKAVELNQKVRVMGLRLDRLAHAVRRVTQHVNLFEKILIPAAKRNIQKIQIVLGDVERSSVVRSKITKSLYAGQRKAALAE
jgi:V/A-type H+-transporting ATPase subunit D